MRREEGAEERKQLKSDRKSRAENDFHYSDTSMLAAVSVIGQQEMLFRCN